MRSLSAVFSVCTLALTASSGALAQAGPPPLMAAIGKGDVAAASALLAHGANPNTGPANARPLIVAIFTRNAAMAHLLIQKGADINHPMEGIPFGGYTPVMISIATVNLDIAKDLIIHHAALHSRSLDGNTPLGLAANSGRVALVNLVLDHGVGVNEMGKEGDTALVVAARKGNLELCNDLLARGATTKGTSLDGYSAVLYAAAGGNTPLMNVLIARGADIKATTADGSSATALAAQSGSLDTLKRVLEAGSSAGAADKSGQTPLMRISGAASAEMVQTLVARGCNVNARDRYGATALMRGALRGDEPAVRALLAAGADPALKDASGATAAFRAAALEHTGIVTALQKGSAEPPTDGARTQYVRAAIGRSITLLQSSSDRFQTMVDSHCYSCHNTSMPALAVGTAQMRGLPVDEAKARRQFEFVAGYFHHAQASAEKSLTSPAARQALDGELVDPDLTAGYGLFGLAACGCKADPSTGAMAMYLASRQGRDGRWTSLIHEVRAPSEDSDVTATAMVVHAMRRFGPAANKAELDRRVEKARGWLAHAGTPATEDKTFRLLGLAWAGANPADPDAQQAIKALTAEQRPDGGWSQGSGMPSDAYATGEVLVALHQAGGIAVDDPAYRRGVNYLLATQDEDGSWYVRSRATPFQGYINTGFPHGKAQYISTSATSWATVALALTIPEVKTAAR